MTALTRYFPLCCLLLLVGCDGADAPPLQQQPKIDTPTAQVFIGNGHTQCANDAQTPAQTQMILVQGGIDVLGSACGVITGVFYPAVCGAGMGEINLHRIRPENVVDAERLGFRNVRDIGGSQAPGTGFHAVNCDTREPIP